MSDKKGSMISPKMVREFLLPYMGRVADFLKARGVRQVHLDTDGDCRSLIPMFMEVGVTGMWPFEQTGNIDLLAIRQQYPTLLMAGGIAKGIWPAARTPSIGRSSRPAKCSAAAGTFPMPTISCRRTFRWPTLPITVRG